jgi:type I restriction enzyme M protein
VRNMKKRAYNGRFGAGLPRISDGSLLFLQHLISKMKQDEKGSRIAIIFNGSPLFTGDAGSGESEIRRWIIENDMLEGIIALPDQLFYNTGISTYIWIVTNRKNNDPMKGPVRTGRYSWLMQ